MTGWIGSEGLDGFQAARVPLDHTIAFGHVLGQRIYLSYRFVAGTYDWLLDQLSWWKMAPLLSWLRVFDALPVTVSSSGTGP